MANTTDKNDELPMDRITLRDAMEAPYLWAMVAAGEPERNIAVQMTYADLWALAKMLGKAKDKKKER